MACLICDSDMQYYFSKKFQNYSSLKNVDYFRCTNCGFVASNTHQSLSEADWQDVNLSYHLENNKREDNPYNRNQRYFYQAEMLYILNRYGLINMSKSLDWGAGQGKLARRLSNLYGIQLHCFDKYINPEINPVSLSDNDTFSVVINTAVFEHVTSREQLDEINSYVSNTGCLAVHTLVPDNIPADESWMYLLPVHCAFHCNQSMQILMEQWGYTSSIYNANSKLWVWFKEPAKNVQIKVNAINDDLGFDYLHFKTGFMDFWK